MEERTLEEIGLSKAEAKIYLSLLKLGASTVYKLAEDTGVHRTNIYMILEKLREKGLVTTFHKENKLHYKAAQPKNLLNYLEEKESLVKDMLPKLEELQKMHKEDVEVEIFKGPEGMKAVFKDMIRERKLVTGIAAAGQLRKYLPVFAKQFVRDCAKYKVKHRMLYSEKVLPDEGFFRANLMDVRYIPKEFTNPAVPLIYGDKSAITIWEPTLVAIVITSKTVADAYRKQFELLWNMGVEKVPDKYPSVDEFLSVHKR